MASREDVAACLQITVERLRDPKLARHFKGWTRVMQYRFTDSGERWYIAVQDGVPSAPVAGEAPGAAIRYEMDTDTFVAVMRGELGGLEAFRRGRVKLDASLRDMLKLQRLT